MSGDRGYVRREQERLRRSFRPGELRLLLIGESAPASGRFFYQRDSALYRAVRDAFRIVETGITDESFLEAFQASGCYLIDLCAEPVDHLDSKSRRAACRASETSLSRRIVSLQPPAIATVVRSIEANVARAISSAHWHGPLHHFPYPGRWSRYRSAFVDSFATKLSELMRQGARHPAGDCR